MIIDHDEIHHYLDRNRNRNTIQHFTRQMGNTSTFQNSDGFCEQDCQERSCYLSSCERSHQRGAPSHAAFVKDLRNLASPGGGDWRRSDGSWYRPGRSSDGSQGHTGRHQPAGEPLDLVDIRHPDAFQVLDKSNARISESIKRVAKKKFAEDAEGGEKFIDR